MALKTWESLDEGSRFWCFVSSTPWQEDQQAVVDQTLAMLCMNWKAHGDSVAASFQTVDRRLIALAADETQMAAATGCSVDGIMRSLKELGSQLNVDLFSRKHVYVREDADNDWRRVTLKEARQSTGEFLDSVGQQKGGWQPIRPIKGSWLAP